MSLDDFFHVFALGLWGGCVAVEMLLEGAARSDPERSAQVARTHAAIDRFIEIPILIAVLGTGLRLLRPELLHGWYLVLIVSGSTAVLINFLCVIPVVRRKRAVDAGEMSRVDAETRWIFRAFWTGTPAAAIAFFSAAVIRGWV
ncbi:MAG: hypothetical protein ACE5FL_09530 [Myxococcota bacterium]